MKLTELSPAYRAGEQAILGRIRELEEKIIIEENAERIRLLERRIRDLQPLLRQSRELAELTARYYERGYHRSEKYTV